MYLSDIYIKNMGAIESLSIKRDTLIKVNGNPRIIILIGKNGTGKTTLLSSIVDSIFEFLKQNFSKVLTSEEYFKVSGGRNLRVNMEYGFSYLKYENKESKIYEYLDKNGKLSFSECKNLTDNLLTLNGNWDNANNKIITKKKENDNLGDFIKNNSYCYFPSDRYEYPYWINKNQFNEDERIYDKERYSKIFDKNFLITNSLKDIKSWILDVFLDTQSYIRINEDGTASTEKPIQDIKVLQETRINIELVISSILQRDVLLNLNFRGRGSSRITLIDKSTKELVLPSLDSFSAGQSTLLSIFLNIIKSTDEYQLIKGFNLNEIEGIVVIDEIELHLHIMHQKDILPDLIALFPKVQFIITSHSPFFLNGMAKKFTSDDIKLIKMPTGDILDTYEEFEEFNTASDIFSELTNDYRDQINNLKSQIDSSSRNTLIITEGKTDWKYLKNSLEILKNRNLYEDLKIDFLEYENEIEMGDIALSSMIKAFQKTPQERKIIFLFDRDNNNILKDYGIEKYNTHPNNVYSFCIPKVSEERDKISLEFYYTDDNLKILDENNRRLFIGNEFHSSSALSICGNFFTLDRNKAGTLCIIDNKVFSIDDPESKNSIALSKNDFAKNIYEKANDFSNMDVTNFKLIFDIFSEINSL